MKKLNQLIIIVTCHGETPRGQDLIEYALMAGFVAVAAGAIMPGVVLRHQQNFFERRLGDEVCSAVAGKLSDAALRAGEQGAPAQPTIPRTPHWPGDMGYSEAAMNIDADEVLPYLKRWKTSATSPLQRFCDLGTAGSISPGASRTASVLRHRLALQHLVDHRRQLARGL